MSFLFVKTKVSNYLGEDSAHIVEMLVQNRLASRNHIDHQFKSFKQYQKEEHERTRECFINIDFQKRRQAAQKSLLQALKFKTMQDRREAIAKAHKNTFEWIFKDPTEFHKPWDSFRDWLRSGQGLYWIQGKAGSGKSTLMEFISTHPNTTDDLYNWSEVNELRVGTFFFWNGGNLEQRSQAGLLRSLLFQIISLQAWLIPDIFPEEWGEYFTSPDSGFPEEWTLPRLKICFDNLIRLNAHHAKLCFFIDGLDEFDGNHADIAAYFKNLSKYPHVKFCLSSRPWPVFEDIFDRVPGLKLQDLTINDIRLYVQDTLVKHKRMIDLSEEEPEETSALCQEIIDKASGVFLWVCLVVRSLLESLRNRDGIDYLRQKLSEFPPELEPLYGHMLNGIDQIYRKESSKIFQIFRASISDAEGGRKLDTVALEGALNAEFIATMTARIQPLPMTEEQHGLRLKRHIRMATQLKSRTKGLLEICDVQDCGYQVLRSTANRKDPTRELAGQKVTSTSQKGNSTSGKTETNPEQSPISYLHRTVKDYLEQEDIWNGILSHTANSNFDPTISLLMFYVMELKTTNIASKTESIYSVAKPALEVSTRCKAATSKLQVSLLDELDRVLSVFWENHGIGDRNAASRAGKHWSLEAIEVSRDLPQVWPSSFLVSAIQYNLGCYLRTKIASNAISVKESNGLPLLAHAFSWIWWGKVRFPKIYPNTIEMFLEYGSDPNQLVAEATVWQHVLHYVHVAFDRWVPELEDDCLQWHAAFKVMLEHGADPEASCPHYCPAYDTRSQTRQFRHLFQGQTAPLELASGKSEKENLKQHRAFHSVSAVVDAVFGERFPSGATELLRLVNNLIRGERENSMSQKASVKRKARDSGRKTRKSRKISDAALSLDASSIDLTGTQEERM